MKWFYNMKIAAKLIISFIIVAALAGIVGYIGFTGIKTMNDTLVQITDENLKSIQNLYIINEAKTAIKAAERTIFSQPDEASTYEKKQAISKMRMQGQKKHGMCMKNYLRMKMNQNFGKSLKPRGMLGRKIRMNL